MQSLRPYLQGKKTSLPHTTPACWWPPGPRARPPTGAGGSSSTGWRTGRHIRRGGSVPPLFGAAAAARLPSGSPLSGRSW
eukprot:11808679-Alexandrium_andersonii.AAC.1